MKAVKVVFDRYGKEYSYACFDDTVKVGDTAIVFAQERYTMVEVTAVADKLPKVANKAIVGIFRKEMYKDNQDKLDTYLRAKEKLDLKLEAFRDNQVYELLAKSDSEAAELIRIVNNV